MGLLNQTYAFFLADQRVNVCHISVYSVFLYLWTKNGFNNPIHITRKQIMKLAHIRSIVTYHKCVFQLAEFGYIRYLPNYNSYLGSEVYIVIR